MKKYYYNDIQIPVSNRIFFESKELADKTSIFYIKLMTNPNKFSRLLIKLLKFFGFIKTSVYFKNKWI
jgi:hypothetical protein